MGEIPGRGSMDSFLDELLKDTHACSHTHTCNPPGPDYSHTHTCLHVHTKIVSASSDDNNRGGNSNNDESAESVGKKTKKRPLGNREAVRKYREKKKAHTASLEDEVVKLREINQQLLKRLQAQTALEAEAARLKCLLVDIRGRIDGEIGSFPYQTCNVQYGKSDEGLLNNQGFSGCDFENLNCLANMGTGSKECSRRGPCDIANVATTTANSSDDCRRKGGNGAATVD